MKINFKKLNDTAVTPIYSKKGDAGLDLTATTVNKTQDWIEYGTDLSFEIPEGYVGYIFPRSSLSNYDLYLSNSVGVIDSGYRGEVKFRFKLSSPFANRLYKVGDRIGQLVIMPVPVIELTETSTLSTTDRNVNGFGSSGR